jgi:hypothetical protein
MSSRRYSFKRRPRSWQLRALRLLLKKDGGAIFAPMRSGKSKVAVDFIGCKVVRDGIERAMIVAPLSALGGWRESIRKDLNAEVEIRLLNYERVYGREPDGNGGWLPVDNDELMRFDPEVLIIDESHRVGDPRTLANKKLFKLVRQSDPAVVLVTGTPLHRKPFYLFGQWKLYDIGKFGGSWTAFKKQYGVWGGYGNYQLLKYRRLDKLRKKIRKDTFFMEHVPPREPTIVQVKFPLKESEGVYRQMAAEGFAKLGKKRFVDAPNPLARHTRLAQMVGGKVRVEDGRLCRVGVEKAKAFDDLLRQLADSEVDKLVVGARFLFELADVGRMCQKRGYDVLLLHGAVSAMQREYRIDQFHETDEPTVFISQIATGSLGIDLSAADTMVLYSLTRSLVDHEQFTARIRKYKDTRPLSYYYMLGEGTIDEINLLAMHEGLEVVKLITDHPEFLSYRGVG